MSMHQYDTLSVIQFDISCSLTCRAFSTMSSKQLAADHCLCKLGSQHVSVWLTIIVAQVTSKKMFTTLSVALQLGSRCRISNGPRLNELL